MDFIQNILADKAGDLLGALKSDAGYTAEQAEAFLPEAGSALGDAMKSIAPKLDMTDLASAPNVGAILGAVDVPGLAQRGGVSAGHSWPEHSHSHGARLHWTGGARRRQPVVPPGDRR